jgi:hypothetical protein
MIKQRINKNGSLLGAVLVVTLALSIVGLSLITLVLSDFKITTKNVSDANAMLVAEAGIEQSLAQLNINDDFVGYPTDQQFFNNSDQGRSTFQTVIENTADSNAKTITSTGKVYTLSNSNTPVSIRKIKVTVVGTGSNGYSVFTGPGGLLLSGNANITNSDVFVNGYISMSGTSKIGTPSQPVNVNVANQACPTGSLPGSTYPTVCSSGNPITMSYSTNIYGTVCATGQTSTGPNNNIQTGSGGEGLKTGCVTPPGSQPTYDRAAHIAAVTRTESALDNNFKCNGVKTVTTPAHLKLTGDYTTGGSCTLTLNGDLYITGNLSLGGASKIKVADSLGATRPVVLVDGTINIGGSTQLIANESGTGIQFISFKSSAACDPGCTAITGNELKTTQNLLTVDVGGAANLPGMVFQAYWGKVRISGSGNVGAAVGQTVDLNGAGTVTFGTQLSSGAKTWTITSYQQLF